MLLNNRDARDRALSIAGVGEDERVKKVGRGMRIGPGANARSRLSPGMGGLGGKGGWVT